MRGPSGRAAHGTAMSAATRNGVALAIVAALASGARANRDVPGLIAELRAADRLPIERAVERARREHPQAFAPVAALRGIQPEFYRRSSARRPDVTAELRKLGPSAFWP